MNINGPRQAVTAYEAELILPVFVLLLIQSGRLITARSRRHTG